MKATARSPRTSAAKVPTRPKAQVRPRTKPSDVRRKDLMKAGERLFLKKGVTATSIDDIVAAADVAKGTFYLYFPSKQELLQALQERFVDDLVEAIQAQDAKLDPQDWWGRLDAWADGGVDFYLDRFKLHDVLFHSGASHANAYSIPDKLIDELAAVLGGGSAARVWDVPDPKMTAVCLYHAMHGGLDYAVGQEKNLDRDALVRTVGEFYRRAVKAA